MNRIIVPIDFSEASMRAAKYAASISHIFNTGITLLHAYFTPTALDEMHRNILLQTEMELIKVKEKLMSEFSRKLKKDYDVPIKEIIRESGSATAIEETCRQNDAVLIIMGMKGEGKSSSLFGSTTTKVMRQSKYPVLVIPEKAKHKKLKSIVLASNFDSTIEPGCYSVLKTIAKAEGAKIKILNVQEDDSSLTTDQIAGKLNTALALSDIEHEFFTMEDDEVTDGIEDFLDDNPAEMLVMVAQKHNLLQRLFGTIHTREMSYETEIPLLVLQGK